MSWLCRSPTGIALFHRLTKLWLRRVCNTPSSVKAVFVTFGQGALTRHKLPFFVALLKEYLTQVGLRVWICVAHTQKFASSSKEAANQA